MPGKPVATSTYWKKKVEGPQTCRDVSTLHTVGGHEGKTCRDPEVKFEVTNEVYKAEMMAEVGYIEEPRSKQVSETSVCAKECDRKSMDWKTRERLAANEDTSKWEWWWVNK